MKRAQLAPEQVGLTAGADAEPPRRLRSLARAMWPRMLPDRESLAMPRPTLEPRGAGRRRQGLDPAYRVAESARRR